MIDERSHHPALKRLNELVGFCERRVRRAAERMTIAATEANEAAEALAGANRRLSEWIEANPDPQMELL